MVRGKRKDGEHKSSYKQDNSVARNRRIHAYKTGAKIRNLSWELTNEQVTELMLQDCSYCGYEPNNVAKPQAANKKNEENPKRWFICNGIDRIDNSQGYTLGNTVTCCKFCNRAKGKGSLKEFLSWLDHVRRL